MIAMYLAAFLWALSIGISYFQTRTISNRELLIFFVFIVGALLYHYKYYRGRNIFFYN